MRTNYSGFALAVSMGLLVVLLGFLALSLGGLVQIGPVEEVAVETPEIGVVPPPAVAVTSKPVTAEQVAGEKLFNANCAQCHAVNEKVVGPALAGITKRRKLPWITAWVHNSAKVIASGDDYAVKIYSDYNQQQMPAFPQLSDKEIADIMAFVSAQMGSAPSADGASPTVVAAK